MPTLTIGAVDVEATLGANVTDLGEYLDRLMSTQAEVEIPGMPGVILAGPDHTPVRDFSFKMYLDGASQAAVRTNFDKLTALVSKEQQVVIGDSDARTILAKCQRIGALQFPTNSRANSLNTFAIGLELFFRAKHPFWKTVTPNAVAFANSDVAMPQGTAPSEPVLTSATGSATTPLITCKDHTGATLWTCQLASQGASEHYRITTARGVMTIEKWNGSAYVMSDASITAGIFPKPLPSDGDAFQTSAWPTLRASTGSWTSTYNRAWR